MTPNLKRTSIEAWASGKVVRILWVLWEVLGSNWGECSFLKDVVACKIVCGYYIVHDKFLKLILLSVVLLLHCRPI